MQHEEIVMDAGELNVVATYRRTIHASLERIWENVLDWEHLPWLHRSAFAAAELVQHIWTAPVCKAISEQWSNETQLRSYIRLSREVRRPPSPDGIRALSPHQRLDLVGRVAQQDQKTRG